MTAPNNVESVALGLVLAARYRQQFHKSVYSLVVTIDSIVQIIVDIVGINKYDGENLYKYINKHHEVDREIVNHPSCLDVQNSSIDLD